MKKLEDIVISESFRQPNKVITLVFHNTITKQQHTVSVELPLGTKANEIAKDINELAHLVQKVYEE